jgi:hypothetical protein
MLLCACRSGDRLGRPTPSRSWSICVCRPVNGPHIPLRNSAWLVVSCCSSDLRPQDPVSATAGAIVAAAYYVMVSATLQGC